jgi:hypothetical protein
MYVSEGVAGKHPFRYGCPPEVARFTLWDARPSGGLSVLLGEAARGSPNESMERK